MAGIGTFGFSGDGGPATSARISLVQGIDVDVAGNLFIADSGNNRIRKVTPAGIISTVAGNGIRSFGGDSGPATFASLSSPRDVAVDVAGNLFIADSGNIRIRKVTPAGIISTVAGNGLRSFGGDNGPAISAPLFVTNSIAVDSGGTLFIADSTRIRKVTPAGIISTVAGNGSNGFSGDGGPAISAQLSNANGVAVDSAGNLFISDLSNSRIRKVTTDGLISTVAGNGRLTAQGDGGTATAALLLNPYAVAVDGGGNAFIADSGHNRIRKVTPNGTISTFAGNGTPGYSGDGGPATSAQLGEPVSVAVDPAGNVFIAGCDGRIRKVNPAGVISTFTEISSWGFCANAPGDDFYYYYYYYYGLFIPGGIATDAQGNLWIAEPESHRIRKVTPEGVVSTVLTGPLSYPGGVAVDTAGNLFIADSNSHRILKLTPGGIMSTVAGTGTSGFVSDGPAVLARLSFPTSVAVDPIGNVFIGDLGNNRIREVTPDGIISTVAGNGEFGFSGDGGPATSAAMSFPNGVAVDAAGNLFIADTNNNRIRRVGLAFVTPALIRVSPNFGAPGGTVNVTLAGTSFLAPITINAGSGITVTNVNVVSDVLATATLTLDSNASLGARSLTVTTSLGTSNGLPVTVVQPFPDLVTVSTHTGNLGVGFNGAYTIVITNVGGAPTAGAMTVTDVLPFGLNFISGTGNGWSCSASGRTVTCANPEVLSAGASTTLALAIDVADNAAPRVIHAPKVTVAGDLIASNNTASDTTTVATPVVTLQMDPTLPVGRQAIVGLTLPSAFPFDVTGTLKLTFATNAATPADDPAIQFVTGGREIAFTIPANSLEARFGIQSQTPSVAFQPGTVAGVLTFSGTLQSGSVETAFSATRTILRQAPSIQSVQTSSQNGFTAAITLLSTAREVTRLVVRFETTPPVRLNCDVPVDCAVSGPTITFDVKSLFDAWFARDTTFGSLSTVRLPFLIPTTVHGDVWITMINSLGPSNSVSFKLP